MPSKHGEESFSQQFPITSSFAIIITTTVQRNSREGRHNHMFRQWGESAYFIKSPDKKM